VRGATNRGPLFPGATLQARSVVPPDASGCTGREGSANFPTCVVKAKAAEEARGRAKAIEGRGPHNHKDKRCARRITFDGTQPGDLASGAGGGSM